MITGSRAYERFTGSQIVKVYQKKRTVYYNTEVCCPVNVQGIVNSICCFFLWLLISGHWTRKPYCDIFHSEKLSQLLLQARSKHPHLLEMTAMQTDHL